ncbi:MAG: helix-turn-helix transcriptional regulator [Planctomycetes bacterium]|nr:helix-turn-helix transcriptional regulator [Planctomycetota bacterium]
MSDVLSGNSGLLDYREVVSERIRHRRGQMTLSAQAVADAVGRHPNTVSNWENPCHASLPGPEDLVSLCRVLKVSIDWLLNPIPNSHKSSGEFDGGTAFAIDSHVLERQLQSTSLADPSWQMAAWFVLDASTFVVYGLADRDAIQQDVDEHIQRLKRRGG